VEVLDGPQAGLTTTADATGGFSLSGTFDDTTRFRATSDGHVTSTRTLQPFCERCSPNWWINFSLGVVAPSMNLAGEYTLTFVADSSCTTLPSELRIRTYTATIPATASPPPEHYPVVVGGGSFYQNNWNVISLGVAGDYVAFWLETLVEELAPNAFLAFGGEAVGSVRTVPGSTITIPFLGSVEYCVTTAPTGRYEVCRQGQAATDMRCESDHHQLVLSRR
jgi:hypothetical protein